jgi:hypothetical protein
MTIAATGVRGESIQKLERLIANSATAQARVGGSPTAEQMKSRIFYPHLENPYASPFPYWVITPKETQSTRDSCTTFDRNGALALKTIDLARVAIDTQEQLKDAAIDFLNFVDGVFAEIEALSLTDDNLTVQVWRDSIPMAMSNPNTESDKQTNRPYFFLETIITWDPSGSGGGG